jgi:hypothetical protein
MKIESAKEFKSEIVNNKAFQKALKMDPIKAVEDIEIGTPLERDVWIYRIVVSVLGLTVILSVAGAILLVSIDKKTPEVLVALGSAAVGALAGLLAPSPR